MCLQNTTSCTEDTMPYMNKNSSNPSFVCSSSCVTPSDQNPTMCRSHCSRVQEGECESFFFYVLLQLHLGKIGLQPGRGGVKVIWSRPPLYMVTIGSGFKWLQWNTAFHVWPQSFFHAHMDHGSYFRIFVLKFIRNLHQLLHAVAVNPHANFRLSRKIEPEKEATLFLPHAYLFYSFLHINFIQRPFTLVWILFSSRGQ